MYRFAFIGPAGTGKTTCAKYLADKTYGYVLSFAEELKRYAKELGWDGQKDERGRKFLQELGRVVREYDENTWVNLLYIPYNYEVYQDSFFVDDLRFPNEAEMLVRNRFKIVRIVPFDFDLNEEWRTHESETALNDYTADYNVVSFKGDIPALYTSLDQLLEKVDNE